LDNSKRSRQAILLLKIYIIIAILFVFSIYIYLSFGGIETENDFENKPFPQNIIVILNSLALGLFGISLFVIYILSAVFFIKWFRRAYCNLHRIGVKHLQHGEGWAAGAWFTPIANLYYPYQIMREIWYETLKLLKNINNKLIESYSDKSVIGWWWSLWIIGFIIDIIAGNTISSIFRENEISEFTFTDIIAVSVDIAAAVAAIIVIRRYSVIENELYNNQDKIIIPSTNVAETSFVGRERDPYFKRKSQGNN